MLRLATEIPKDCWIACSGGVDSMVLLDFVLRAKKNPRIIYVNHNTEHGHIAEEFLLNHCQKLSLFGTLRIEHISTDRDLSLSQEEFWRNERNNIFHNLGEPVLTAHHLMDAVEWWIFSALHGEPRLVPKRNGNILRPFLTTSKSEIVEWAKRKNVPYIDDPSNESRKYMRNIIRHDVIPHALKVNPGLETVVRKKYELC